MVFCAMDDCGRWAWHHGSCVAGGQGKSISKRCKAMFHNTMFFFSCFRASHQEDIVLATLIRLQGKKKGGVRMSRVSKGHDGRKNEGWKMRKERNRRLSERGTASHDHANQQSTRLVFSSV